MATKKYVVREGFVLVLKITKATGETYERDYQGGEEVTLDDADAALHAHKLEFASQKDRDAAAEAEKRAAQSVAAAANPVELVAALIAALGQAQAAAGIAAPAPAAAAG
jgi:hypothetical protein